MPVHAKLQRWRLNIETRTLEYEPVGRRKMRPMQKALKVEGIADELVSLILVGAEDPRLKWREDGAVTVRMSSVLPD